MTHRLVVSPRAAADLGDIAEFIARHDAERAASFVRELEARCLAIAAIPTAYPGRDDLAPGLRMAVHGRYLVFFRVVAVTQDVRIERVLHGARHLRPLL